MSRLVAAAALAGAMLVWPSVAPAGATGCSSSSGVSVVVDFAGLGGGGVQSGCVSGGGGDDARELFEAAGFSLTDVASTPGFVCRVSGVPARSCADTPPDNAYWGLWWSDGRGGDWSYATLGVDSLTIPDGGYVAFAWDAAGGSSRPRFDPAKHAAPSASPTPPATSPGGSGNGGGTGGGNGGGKGGGSSSGGGTADGGGEGGGATTGPGASGSATPSTGPSASTSATPGKAGKPGKRGKNGKPEATPTPSASAGPTKTGAADGELTGTAPTAAEPADDGLPGFLAPLLIAALFGVAGVVFLLRRRSGPA